MRTIKLLPRQTLFDIALMAYGDVEGVFYLVEDNDLPGILSPPIAGTQLVLREGAMRARMYDFLSDTTIATGEGTWGEGIGFWKIAHKNASLEHNKEGELMVS